MLRNRGPCPEDCGLSHQRSLPGHLAPDPPLADQSARIRILCSSHQDSGETGESHSLARSRSSPQPQVRNDRSCVRLTGPFRHLPGCMLLKSMSASWQFSRTLVAVFSRRRLLGPCPEPEPLHAAGAGAIAVRGPVGGRPPAFSREVTSSATSWSAPSAGSNSGATWPPATPNEPPSTAPAWYSSQP